MGQIDFKILAVMTGAMVRGGNAVQYERRTYNTGTYLILEDGLLISYRL